MRVAQSVSGRGEKRPGREILLLRAVADKVTVAANVARLFIHMRQLALTGGHQ
jgi:hypothetical protein